MFENDYCNCKVSFLILSPHRMVTNCLCLWHENVWEELFQPGTTWQQTIQIIHNSIMICIQTARRYIWRHSIGYSISTSPAPIIYFGLFSWRKRFYKPNLVWQVWWRRANKSLHGALRAAAGSPIRGWILLWFDSWLPHSPLWSLCVCDPPCPSARKRK